MNTQFSQILSEIISNSELSKNEMIRNCDIDRSSFFKFLNGTRTPTPEQLNTICKKLLLTPDEERELREAYLYVTGGNKTITISNSIIDMMWALEKAENTKEQPFFLPVSSGPESSVSVITGSEQVLMYLQTAVMRETLKGDGKHEIDAFLPNSAEPFWTWLMSYMLSDQGRGIIVRSLTVLPSRIYNTDSVVQKFKYPLLCSLLYPESFAAWYYYGNTAEKSDPGILYGYTLILDSCTILLNSNMDKAIVVSDVKSCNDGRMHFLNNLNSAHPFTRTITCKEIGKALGGTKYCYGGCGLNYPLWDKNTVKYFSVRDIENSFNTITAGVGDHEAKNILNRKRSFVKNVLDCIGSKTFLIDERVLPSAVSWTVALTLGEEPLIYIENSHTLVLIDEIHIVRAFVVFFESLSFGNRVINPELAREITQRFTSVDLFRAE